MNAAHARALAELLQVLTCGEESAALAFDHLAASATPLSLRGALAQIAADELEHQRLLGSLEQSLPRVSPDAAFQNRIRRFFMRLADRDIRVHCVRIVAIDSAVCHLLGALRRRGGPLAADNAVRSTLARIHRDEARHVVIATGCATPLLGSLRGRDILCEARERLTRLLESRGAALDGLCVDPDRLFALLRRGYSRRTAA